MNYSMIISMRVQNIWVNSIICKTCLSKSQGKLICLFLLALWRLGDGSKVSSSLTTIILRNARSHFLSQFMPRGLGQKKKEPLRSGSITLFVIREQAGLLPGRYQGQGRWLRKQQPMNKRLSLCSQ